MVTGTNLKFHLSNLVPFGSLRRGPAGLGKSAFCQQRGQFYGVVRVSFAPVCSGHRTNQDWSTKSDTNSVNIPIKESVLALQTHSGLGLPETRDKLLSSDCAPPSGPLRQIDVRPSRGMVCGWDPPFLRSSGTEMRLFGLPSSDR